MLTSLAFIVVIVIDQLRTDQLFKSQEMLQNQGLSQLAREGIFYEDAQHDNFFNMTCPGHIAISAGALPGLTGIFINRDWDHEKRMKRYCFADTDYSWLDAEEESKDYGETGTSPRRLKVTNVADELKMRWPKDSIVLSVAAKDRAAIAMGGHLADAAFWYAPETHMWTTSTYYQKDKTLPAWVKEFNKARKFSKEYEASLSPIGDTAELAVQLAKNKKLGTHKKPDMLWVSFSTHDVISHETGEDLVTMQKVMKEEDRQIGRLLKELKTLAGSKKFLVVLTSDHGNAINAASGPKLGVPSGQLSIKDVTKRANECMKAKGYSPKSDGQVVPFVYSMTFFLDKDVKDKTQAALALKECAKDEANHVLDAFTKEEIMQNRIPQTPWLKNLAASIPNESGPDVVAMLRPYWNSNDKNPVNHETPFVHDSHVPIVVWWPGVKPQRVFKRVSVLDIAPTLSRLLEIRRPSGASGQLLQEVLVSGQVK